MPNRGAVSLQHISLTTTPGRAHCAGAMSHIATMAHVSRSRRIAVHRSTHADPGHTGAPARCCGFPTSVPRDRCIEAILLGHVAAHSSTRIVAHSHLCPRRNCPNTAGHRSGRPRGLSFRLGSQGETSCVIVPPNRPGGPVTRTPELSTPRDVLPHTAPASHPSRTAVRKCRSPQMLVVSILALGSVVVPPELETLQGRQACAMYVHMAFHRIVDRDSIVRASGPDRDSDRTRRTTKSVFRLIPASREKVLLSVFLGILPGETACVDGGHATWKNPALALRVCGQVGSTPNGKRLV